MYRDWIEALLKVVAYLDELETPLNSKKEWLDYLDMHEGLEEVIKQLRQEEKKTSTGKEV
jgi:hypothetical protein|tara:strand:+ start:1652 stop:1831 length:180 start_codon:yes stop_codon:yes gene_type:complete